MIELRRATSVDALTIATTRQKVWDETYRGIYPNDVIDHFDYAWHTKRDRARIEKDGIEVWMVLDGNACVGYYTYGDVCGDGTFWLMSLYLRRSHQCRGLGRQIFEQICMDGRKKGHKSMRLQCSQHNLDAQSFYVQMGGVITFIDGGHENRQEDICEIEFTL